MLCVNVLHHFTELLIKTQWCYCILSELGFAAIWALDSDFVIAKIVITKHLAGDTNRIIVCIKCSFNVHTREVSIGDFRDVLRRKFAVFVT